MKQKPIQRPLNDHDDRYDLNALLHPANAFAAPSDVVNDADLTLSEKRAILASWASNACAVEAAPALRRPPGRRIVGFDEIIDAMRELDRHAGKNGIPHYRIPHYRRVLANRQPGVFGRKSQGPIDDSGPSLN
jgi:hypothetical protein